MFCVQMIKDWVQPLAFNQRQCVLQLVYDAIKGLGWTMQIEKIKLCADLFVSEIYGDPSESAPNEFYDDGYLKYLIRVSMYSALSRTLYPYFLISSVSLDCKYCVRISSGNLIFMFSVMSAKPARVLFCSIYTDWLVSVQYSLVLVTHWIYV